MTTVIPDEGLTWWRNKGIDHGNAPNEKIYEVGVGDGTAGASTSDTQLDNELHRATIDGNTVSVSTGPGFGQFTAKITVGGGAEVPADADLTEFGIWAIDPADSTAPYSNGSGTDDSDDIMIYRGVRQAVTIESGIRKTFSIQYDITQA